jgi:hypothetical protein
VRELRFEDINEDGTALVLVDDENKATFEVAIDKRLLSSIALARVKVPPPQPTAQASDARDELSPAEIQSRLRMGHSPEEIVSQTGVNLDRVMRYVAPIVNERAWIAERAAAVKLRKGNEQIALVDVVTNRLESLASDEVGLAWDAWRRDDGLWAIKLSYRTAHGPREAKWIFDASVSSIAPDDAEAEWLMEIEPPATPAAEKPPRRLVSVPAPAAAEPELEAEPEPVPAPAPAMHSHSPAPAPVMHSPAAEAVREPVDEDATAEHERPKIPSWDEILFGSPARPRE